MTSKGSSTLVIAPHMDDEAISCGGLIAKRVAEGGSVAVLAIYGRRYSYVVAADEAQRLIDLEEEKDFLKSCAALGACGWHAAKLSEGEPAQVGYYRALFEVESKLADFSPDEVVISASDDLNQDHRFLHHVLGIALRPANLGQVKRVLEFFALDGTLRQPNYLVELTEAQVNRKLRAVLAYRREARGGYHPRSEESIRAQLKVWGTLCNAPYAEGYRVKFMRE